MTSKEALESYVQSNEPIYPSDRAYNIIKKDLEILEKIVDIIQHKQFSGYAILDTENVEEYNHRIKLENLTQEEYDLLKGLLKKELEK